MKRLLSLTVLLCVYVFVYASETYLNVYQKSGEILSFSLDKSFTTYYAGQYMFICSDKSTIRLSLNDVSKTTFSEQAETSLQSISSDEETAVYDLSGKVICQGSNINTSSLTKGTYIIQSKSSTHKITIQ